MKEFFRKAGRSIRNGLSEGMGLAVPRDNDYNAISEDVNKPEVSDEDIYKNFLEFCKKYKTSPKQDGNVEALLIRILESRPKLAAKLLRNKK